MAPSQQINRLIASLTDWRGPALAKVRQAFLDAGPEIVEEWKWRGSPVWCHAGNLAVGNAHKDKIKLTFPHGASLDDPKRLFNAGLTGNTWRAIDFFENSTIDAPALTELIERAVARNLERKSKPKSRRPRP